jgi:hypothetical protein
MIKQEINEVFMNNQDLTDHRQDYWWVEGFLGSPDYGIIFLAENPSLPRMREAKNRLEELDEESQWNISRGDKIFRDALVYAGFKEGTIESKGGWKCYITNIVKKAYQPSEWEEMDPEKQFELVKKFSSVLQKEIDMINPLIIVVMGKGMLRRLLDRAVREGVVRYPTHTDIQVIWHYAYFNRGGFNDKNVAKYKGELQRIRLLLQNKQKRTY